MTVVVAFVEMFTVSAEGLYGLVMNVVSGCTFACTAAFIYKKKRTLLGAIIGLAAATIVMTGVMMAWNYIVVPLYMPNASREFVVGLLIPFFMPFNLFNGIVNSSLTLLLYKPLTVGLQKARILPAPSTQTEKRKIFNPGVIAVSLFVLATAMFWSISSLRAGDERDVITAGERITAASLVHPYDTPDEVTTALNLPLTGRSSTEISWSSSHPLVIQTDGTVNRPNPGSGTVTVTLTATITKNRAMDDSTQFTFIVMEDASYYEAVRQTVEALSLPEVVTENLNLLTRGRFGTNITWSSTNLNIIAENGTVTRPAVGQGDALVMVSAFVSQGILHELVDFYVIVPEETPED
jgi:hypothetical protein